VAIHLLYVDEWTYVRAANVSQVVILACDRAAWLKRQARRPVSYAGATVQPNPALELQDVVQVNDGALGATVCRVSELDLVWYPQDR
jgi:hypothetical protein